MPNQPPQNLTIATTGASGSVFLRHLLLAVERDVRVQAVNFIASDSGLRVMAGSDCGFETIAGRGRVAEDVVWAKFKSMAEGAKLASSRLF